MKKYNSITKYIPSTEYRTQDILYVLNQSDLPRIEHKDILEQEKNDNQIKLINNDLKIYVSIIDVNSPENEKIKEKWDSKKI